MHIFCKSVMICTFLINYLCISSCENVKKSIDDNREDNGDTSDDIKDDSLQIPTEDTNTTVPCSRRANSLMHEIQSAGPKQFAFMAAVLSHQMEYLCAGTMVSASMILTTAQCLKKPINYVLVNTIKDRKEGSSVVLQITKSEKFPTYVEGEQSRNVGIIYTEKHNTSIASKIRLSSYSSTSKIVDMEAIGFGLNADVGQTKELQYVGIEHRPMYDGGELMKGFFDCIDTKVKTCFKDVGGPVLFDNEMIGIIVRGNDDCASEITSTFAINLFMVEVLPTFTFKAWLDERINKNEKKQVVALATYPLKPTALVKNVTRSQFDANDGIRIRSIFIHILLSPVFIYFFNY